MGTEYATLATRLLGADRHVEGHDGTPHFTFAQPIFATAASPIVGHLMGIAAWETYLEHLVSSVPSRLTVVLSNTCDADAVQSFWLEGGEVGSGDSVGVNYTVIHVPFLTKMYVVSCLILGGLCRSR
jgi:hypothetical protein